MADFAPNFTCRLKVRYSVLGLEHTVLWRLPRGTTSPAAWISKFEDYLDAFSSARYTSMVMLSAEFSEEDSDFFLPTTVPLPAAGSAAAPVNPVSQSTHAISHVGRSTAGHKAKFHLFGTVFNPEEAVPADNFRLTTAESVLLAGAVNVLNSAPLLVANDNNPVTWYPYVNSKYMDHWVKEVRA